MGKSAILTFDLSPPCLPLTMFFKNTKTYMPVFDKLTMLNFYICVYEDMYICVYMCVCVYR